MKFLATLTAIILVISNLTYINHAYASTVGTKPTIESMNVEQKEVTIGDTAKISVKIKEYQEYRYLNLSFTAPITGNGISIQLEFNEESKLFEGNFPINNNIESGNYLPYRLSLYGSSITSIYSDEYEFENGEFIVHGTEGIDLIESIHVDQKEVTSGDTVKVGLKTSSHEGIRYMNSYFESPLTNQRLSVSLYYNPDTNEFEGYIPISSITESGTYKLTMLNTYEVGNNTTVFSSSRYADKFQHADFTVSGTNATNILESITHNKHDVTIGETINFVVKMPKLVGINYININFYSPISGKSFTVDMYYNSETKNFEGNLLVTNTFELGTYDLFMLAIYDTAGNTTVLYDDSYEELENGNFTFFKEENAPTFRSLSLEKNSVKPGENVRINLEATDDTKLQQATIHYIAPKSKNKSSIELSFDNNTSIFNGEFPITESSEEGIWQVDSIEIKDTNLNTTIIKAVDFDLSSGEFTVEDVTAPSAPSVDEVTDKSTSVLGTAEAGSTITVKTGELVLGKGTTTTEGKYSVTISLQYAGSILTVTSTDNSGNVSEVNNITVIDVTAPKAPTVNEVTDKSTSVTGTAEVGSTIIVKAGTTVIGNATTNTDGKYVVSMLTQKVGTKLIVTTTDKVGNMSEITEVIVIDVTAPTSPIVNEVTDTSTSVTGTGETGSTVTIIAGTTVLATGITAADGTFSITIPKQKAGTILTITATDAAGNVSLVEEVVVVDVTAPTIPTVNEVTDKSTSVSGTAELGSLIIIKSGTIEIGSDTVDSEGKYSILIKLQKAGTKLTVTSIDTAKNISEPREITVTDVTAPTIPTVNEITDKSTSVTGTAEIGSSITVNAGMTILGTSTTYIEGKYTVTIPKQEAGTILSVTATDATGNTSGINEVTVTDHTSPSIPTVNEVTDKSTNVTGTGEIGSSITVITDLLVIGLGNVDIFGDYLISIPKQKAGTILKITATDSSGNTSDVNVITVKDVTAPIISTINEVTDKSTSVTGIAEVGSTITVKEGTTEIGTTTTDTEEKYVATILKQKAGTKLTVIATDNAGNISEPKEVTVKDITAPTAPTVDEVTDKSTSVTGTAEAGSSITVKADMTVIGTGIINAEGQYTVFISKQKAGTKLIISATDSAGNTSDLRQVTVIDVTAPTIPTVNEVTDKSTSVIGTAEAGSSIVVKSGINKIGTAISNSDGQFTVSIPKQNGGEQLTVTATDDAGNVSEENSITVRDVTAPTIPKVDEVTDKSTSVTGSAESGSSITIKVGTKVLETGKAVNDGSFIVSIPQQKTGIKLTVTSTDISGNSSDPIEVTVTDATAPLVPTVNEVTDKSTSVSGTAEVGSQIKIKSGMTEIGSGTVDSEGIYSVQIGQQKAGTKLAVTATDTAGNTSGIREVTVVDVTAPTMPTVSEVTDQSTSVTGTAEVGSLITIKSGTIEKGSDTVDNEGNYSILIELQKAGTKLTVTSIDTAQNSSDPKEVTVTDATAPLVPTVNEVTDKSTNVSGTAEIGSLIIIKSGTTEIGSGTVDSEGNYNVQVTQQKAGTKLSVTAIDKSGNTSGIREVTVLDVTAPTMPTVNEVTDKSMSVTGSAEVGSSITIKVGTTIVGTGKTTTDGKFSVEISNQKAKEILTVTATDATGNVSAEVKQTVVEVPPEVTNRIAGNDRYATAVSISQEGWDSAKTVILATGANFPDALAGGPLAYKEDAPILLTRPTRLVEVTELEIKRLNAKKVLILGSKGAISLDVENQLKQIGLVVERIGGENRFETAALIAERLPSEQAIITFGFNFPDVLSISPYAAKNGIPILLTRSDRVPAETLNAMADKNNTIIVGSTGVISESVMKQFPQPVRYGGATRFDTGKQIITQLQMGTGKAYVATGRNFPDALAGSVLAAKNNAPILLVNEKTIPTPTKDLIFNYDSFSIFGSRGAVGDEVQIELDLALENK